MTLFDQALEILQTPGATDKAQLGLKAYSDWQNKILSSFPEIIPSVPMRPARADKPVLLPPGQMPKRRLGSVEGRATLLHAIAHIELNAIDLAFDMICRFGPDIPAEDQPQFLSDWVRVGGEEAKHFTLLSDRLIELGMPYGSLPAHDGLWEAAEKTADHVLARLAIAPLVLEARGLDVTPQMIQKLTSVGDQTSAALLQIIYDEEIGHVGIGATWFRHICATMGRDSDATFAHFVSERFPGGLKKPFNHDARQAAGLERHFYETLTS